MSRVLVDIEDLQRAARTVGQAGGDLEETAHHVTLLGSRLPAPLASLYAEASWSVRQGLETEAEALTRLATELRLVGRAVELALAGGFDPRLAADWPHDWRHRWPPFPPPTTNGGHLPADEEILRALRERTGWQIVSSPGGLLRLQLSAAIGTGQGHRQGTSSTEVLAIIAVVLGLLIAAGMGVNQASTGSATPPSPSPTPSPRCDALRYSDDVDKAKGVLLDPRHIDAVRRERRGEVVFTWSNGISADHITDYK